MSKKRNHKRQKNKSAATQIKKTPTNTQQSIHLSKNQTGLQEYQLGLDAMNREDFSGSLPHFQRAAQLLGDRADLYYHTGLSFLSLKQFNKSLKALSLSIALDQSNPDVWAAMGDCYEELKRYRESKECYGRALDLNDQHGHALLGYAWILCLEGNPTQAIEISRRACELYPNYPHAWQRLAVACHLTAKNEEASIHLGKAISQHPPLKKTFYLELAIYYKKYGHFAEYTKMIRKAIETDPDDVETRIEYCKQSRPLPDEAIVKDLTRRIAELNNWDLRCKGNYCLGAIFAKAKMAKESFAYYSTANKERLQKRTFKLADFAHNMANIKKSFSKSLPSPITHPGIRPVFIIGMPRSGTTLIEQILGSHPAVTAGGEQTTLPEILNGFDMIEAKNWNDKLKANLHEISAVYRNEIQTLAESNTTFVTDKLPGNYQHLGLIRAALPEALIIHCMRDPRDTCLSCYFTDFNSGHEYSYDLASLGQVYTLYHELMEFWREKFPGRFLDVRYEEVVGDLEGQTRRLLDYCGLPWDDRCLRFHETERMVNTASYAQVRKPIYRSSIGRWKQYENHLGPLLANLKQLPESLFWQE